MKSNTIQLLYSLLFLFFFGHRLNHARHLLESRKYSTIAQVAYKVGYKNANAFARSFKQRFGTTPTEVLEE
ncbi:MAG: AraC-like DNA-binding protein [Polaribacter sp.]